MAAMLEAFQPNQQDNLHLRLHRARSVILTSQELIEIRAAQRTFEGAYIRTALSQFSFALVILKIFTSEFYAIGALFAVYGSAILAVSVYRRYEGNRQFFHGEVEESESDDDDGGVADGNEEDGLVMGGNGEASRSRRSREVKPRRTRTTVKPKFRTSGDSVALMTLLSFAAYVTLFVLTLTLGR